MSEWTAQLSDFLTAKWGEIIAILSSSAFVTFLLTVLGKFILTAIENRARRKTELPLLKQFENMESSFKTMFNDLSNCCNTYITDYTKALDDKMTNMLKEYQATKQKVYNGILEQSEGVVEELSKTTNEIIKTIENTEIEPISAQSEIIEENVADNGKVAQCEDLVAKTSEYKVAKRVIDNGE